ncbi:two-component system response regulator [Thermoplasmatales archaeon ex4484_6]|nr:MAG: two-component system response regulator [Thermoplasmatales archaeon ex4484_6]RLF66699.1 MAG: two-component system response regulator [Thermoplasmata archaeon]
MGKKVLIADDSRFMRMLLKNILIPAGYEIVGEAEDGVEAIEHYRKLRPDLVTMDIIMPNLGGLEALKGIISEDPGAKVVMCTALGQEDKVREAVIHGARGYIVKPFKAERVRQELEKVLSK